MKTPTPQQWVYLDRKPGSLYKQLFVKERNIAARTIYGYYASDEEPRTSEQIASDLELPLEAFREAIAYVESDPPEIYQDWLAEEALEEATGMKDPEYRRTGKTRRLSLEDAARISRL